MMSPCESALSSKAISTGSSACSSPAVIACSRISIAGLNVGERRALPVAVVAFEPELTVHEATWFVERVAPQRMRIEVHGRYHRVVEVTLDGDGRPSGLAETERRGVVEWHAQ